MNTYLSLSRFFVFSLVLLASASCNAWHGGGGYHGGGYYHGGGGYYHGGGGYYHNGGWGGISVGIPLGGYYGASYYAPSCYTQRVCNYNGCWLQQRCN